MAGFGVDNYLKKRVESAIQPAVSPLPQQRATPSNPAPTVYGADQDEADYQTTYGAGSPDDTRTDLKNKYAPGLSAAPMAPITAKPKVNSDPVSKYIDNISQTLAGNDNVVKNAQNTTNTQNSVQNYLAGRGAAQQNVNAGFTPGTLQSQRTTDRFQATANEANLGRQNQVNQLQRDRASEALGAANQLRQEGRQDTQTLINSVTDPVARAFLTRIDAEGGDVNAAYSQLYTKADGTQGTELRPDYRSKSPAETAYADAEDWIKVTQPGLQPGSPEYNAAVLSRVNQADKSQRNPIDDSNRQAETSERLRAASTKGLNALTDEEYEAFAGDLSITPLNSIPTDAGGIEALVGSGSPFVKTPDGEVYQITGRNSQLRRNKGGTGTGDRTTGWAEALNRAGDRVYISDNGDIIEYEPPDAPDGYKVTYNPDKGAFELLYATSGGRRGKVYDPATQKWVEG